MSTYTRLRVFHQSVQICTEIYPKTILTLRFLEEHSYLHSGLLGKPEHLHSWGLSRVYQKVPARSTSVERGAIRGQHRALSEECGAIRKRNIEPSVEPGVIQARCGAISSNAEIYGFEVKLLSVDDGAIRGQDRAHGEECGAIRGQQRAPSVEYGAIRNRCGTQVRNTEQSVRNTRA